MAAEFVGTAGADLVGLPYRGGFLCDTERNLFDLHLPEGSQALAGVRF